MKAAWVAVLEDGGVFVEGSGRTWDDLPPCVPIRSLQIRDLSDGKTLVSLDSFVKFYAYNEARARFGRQGVPTAKVIGGVRRDGTVKEIRLDFAWSEAELTAPGVVEGALRDGTGD